MDVPKLNLIPRKWVDPENANENMSLIYEVTVLSGLSYIGKTTLTDSETDSFGKIYDTNRTDINLSLRRIRTHVNEIIRAEFTPPKDLTIKYEYLSKFPMCAIIFNVIAIVPTTLECFYEGLYIDSFQTLTPFGLNERRSGCAKRRQFSPPLAKTKMKLIRSYFEDVTQKSLLLENDMDIKRFSLSVTSVDNGRRGCVLKWIGDHLQATSWLLKGNFTFFDQDKAIRIKSSVLREALTAEIKSNLDIKLYGKDDDQGYDFTVDLTPHRLTKNLNAVFGRLTIKREKGEYYIPPRSVLRTKFAEIALKCPSFVWDDGPLA